MPDSCPACLVIGPETGPPSSVGRPRRTRGTLYRHRPDCQPVSLDDNPMMVLYLRVSPRRAPGARGNGGFGSGIATGRGFRQVSAGTSPPDPTQPNATSHPV